MLETCSKLLSSARKLLEIYAAWLGLARENELLKNAGLEFYFPCSKSPNTNEYRLNLNQDMNMVKRRSIVKVIDALFILNDLLYVYMYISIIVIVDLKCVICSHFYYI